jgi:uncharacterized protein YqgC (DUF456 family)
MESLGASTLWWVLSVLLIVVGVIGTVLPMLPGVVLVLGGIVLGAWIDGFAKVSGVTVVVIAVIAALAWATDYLAAMLGAKRAGASKEALIGAAIGTVAGIFTGLIGLIFMPLAGAMAGEYIAQRRRLDANARAQGAQAARVGVATWIGMLLGTVAKLVLTFLMVGIFAVAYFV